MHNALSAHLARWSIPGKLWCYCRLACFRMLAEFTSWHTVVMTGANLRLLLLPLLLNMPGRWRTRVLMCACSACHHTG
jgi:hypothetical protein